MKRNVCGIMLALFLLCVLSMLFDIHIPKSKSRTIVVPNDYKTIQEAIDAAEVGDTILVKTGLYQEHLYVNKTLTLMGEDPNLTIISGKGSGTVILLSANNVNISNFRITDADFGIRLNQSNYCNIRDNIIDSIWWCWGLHLYQSNDNIINNNTITNSHMSIYMDSSNNNTVIQNKLLLHRVGIFLLNTSQNHFINNTLEHNEEFGVYMLHSNGNVFRNNTMKHSVWNFGVWGSCLSEFIHDLDTSNTVDGKPMYYWVNKNNNQIPSDAGYVAAVNCSDITVRDLNLKNCGQAILLAGTNNSLVENVNISDSWYGIFAFQSNNNVFSKNKIKKSLDSNIFLNCSNYNLIYANLLESCSEFGLFLETSNYTTIKENTVRYNLMGLGLRNSVNNTFYHNNFVHNSIQISTVMSLDNIWDDGYPSGGNYWKDYTGVDLYNGPYQNETGSDGIGDTPYTIDANNTDRYPLMAPFNTFEAGVYDGMAYNVNVISNSTISDFNFNVDQKSISFNVTGNDGTIGFCRVTIPKNLLWADDDWTILVDSQPITDYTKFEDENCTHLYFTYNHSTKTVTIKGTHVIPEYPSTIILTMFMLIMAILVVLTRNRRLKHH